MTIDRAIEILTRMANYCWDNDTLEDADACQIGIEALKRINLARSYAKEKVLYHLPGETEE